MTYNKDDRRRIYWLIEKYINLEIDAKTFCDEYYYCFDQELDYSVLSKREYQAFSELSDYCARFSEFESDIKDYPGVYTNEKTLKEKILEIRIDLHQQFSEIDLSDGEIV